MPRFFVPSVQEDSVRITGADGLHLTKALRVRPGEKLTLCDGNGTDALCEVASASAGEVDLRVLRRYPNETEPRLRLHLYQCFPKGDKFELILQKAVELGAARIIPVFSERCVSRPDRKAQDNRLSRFRRIAAEAAGQSERGVIPEVGGFVSFREAVEGCPKPGVLFYEKGGVPLRSLEGELLRLAGRASGPLPDGTTPAGEAPSSGAAGGAFSIFIGPEGGLAEEEAALAEANGIRPASLGPRILRTETAGLAAAAALLLMSGDL